MRLAALALALLVLPGSLYAQTRTLVYTSPCFTMHIYRVFDEQLADSITVRDCWPSTEPLRETLQVHLYKRDIAAGADFFRVATHFVPPCLEDSFPAQGPGHYYVMAENSQGGSCNSPQVTILPDVMTDVEPSTVPTAPILKLAIFNIHGQFLRFLPATSWAALRTLPRAPGLPRGVYWLRATTAQGTLKKRIFVH